MKRQRRTVICREGWYYLLVLALVFGTAISREVNLLLMLAGILTGPVVFSWRAVTVTLRGLELRRKVPQGVCAGDLLVGHVTLTNTRRRWGSWAVEVEDPIQRETAPEGSARAEQEKPFGPGLLFPYVPAGQSRTAAYRGRPTRRGRYRLGPLTVSTRFPFGFLRRSIRVGSSDTLTVFPRLGRLTRRWIRRHHESFYGTHRREQRHGHEGDFYGVRPWRQGDSRRWVHARTSARLGEPVVCQFEQPRSRDLAVLVDLWQPERPQSEQLENVELAVSFAATVVADLCRQGGGNLCVAVAGPQPQRIVGPASALLLNDVMQRLAVAEARAEDHLADLLRQELGQLDPGTEIVLVSTRPVDLDDASRFAPLWADSTGRAALGRIRRIDTSGDELAEYFQVE